MQLKNITNFHVLCHCQSEVPKPYTFQEEDIVNDDWGQDDEALGVEGEHVVEFAPPEVEYDVDAEVSSNPKP